MHALDRVGNEVQTIAPDVFPASCADAVESILHPLQGLLGGPIEFALDRQPLDLEIHHRFLGRDITHLGPRVVPRLKRLLLDPLDRSRRRRADAEQLLPVILHLEL